MERFLKNCFILLLVDKKPGNTKANTAIKKTADINWFTSMVYELFQNFFAFSKKLFITGSGLLVSILLNSSKISFCLFDSEVGTWVTILIYKSPNTLLLRTGIPFPLNRNCFPCCVPAGIFIFDLPPSIDGTSTVVPNAAFEKDIGN